MTANSGSFSPGESGNRKGRPKGSGKPKPQSLRQLKMRGEEICPDALELWRDLVRDARDGDASLQQKKLGSDAGQRLVEFTYGKASVRNDAAGLPEGFMTWPQERKLEWARAEKQKAEQLEAYLLAGGAQEAG